ncbi:MAG: helix-hairpin-helix domain-containing protein, partial [Myxococcota bacterium]
MTNAHIIDGLREISWLLSLREEDFFRSRAYRKAADALAKYEGDLAQLIDAGQAADLPGVGRKTATVVGELHQTGRSQLLSDLRRRFPREVGRLARIPGLGLGRLQTLHRELGIETADDLQKAIEADALAKVKGFGPAIIGRVKKALADVARAEHRLLLPHARTLASAVVERWTPMLGALSISGEVRRRLPAVESIDIVGQSEQDLPDLPGLADDCTPVRVDTPHAWLRGWA